MTSDAAGIRKSASVQSAVPVAGGGSQSNAKVSQ